MTAGCSLTKLHIQRNLTHTKSGMSLVIEGSGRIMRNWENDIPGTARLFISSLRFNEE